ncbi:MAG: hypothetical protein PPP58_09470 [Natronomonas sp.]
MQFKPVPRPASLVDLAERQAALPLVPDDRESCCVRLADRTDVSREAAPEWITFLRALGLAERTQSGYRKTDRSVDDPAVALAFRERVYGADAVLDAVEADGPITAAEVRDRLDADLPTWERGRRQDPGSATAQRIERILRWAVQFDVLRETDTGYVASERSD